MNSRHTTSRPNSSVGDERPTMLALSKALWALLVVSVFIMFLVWVWVAFFRWVF